MLGLSVLLGAIASLAVAQFPPTPEGVTVLKSKFHENVTISFKEVGQYMGHVSPTHIY